MGLAPADALGISRRQGLRGSHARPDRTRIVPPAAWGVRGVLRYAALPDHPIRIVVARSDRPMAGRSVPLTPTPPEAAYTPNGARDRLIRQAASRPDCALGFKDETWWSRLAAPAPHTWAEPDWPLRLVEQMVARGARDPTALSCDGLLARSSMPDNGSWERARPRFADSRAVSAATTMVRHQIRSSGVGGAAGPGQGALRGTVYDADEPSRALRELQAS